MERFIVITTEKEYINQEDPLVEVSFSLSGPDWCELQKSDCWGQVEEFLYQKKKMIAGGPTEGI